MIKKIIATTVVLLVNNVNAQTIDNQLLIVPNENFYGWYMNKKENEIKVLFHKV